MGGDVVRLLDESSRRRHASDVDALLDRERDPAERTRRPPRNQGSLGGSGLGPRLVEARDDDRVQLGIEAFDPLEVSLEQL
jgi:hypothetical protein